jgi:hypothetical protein
MVYRRKKENIWVSNNLKDLEKELLAFKRI